MIDSYQDYLSEGDAKDIAMMAMVRQGAAQMVEKVLDWSPAGVEGPNDED